MRVFENAKVKEDTKKKKRFWRGGDEKKENNVSEHALTCPCNFNNTRTMKLIRKYIKEKQGEKINEPINQLYLKKDYDWWIMCA